MRIDTIKMQIPNVSSYLEISKDELFHKTKREKGGLETNKIELLDKTIKPIGVSSFSLDTGQDVLTLEISSKILLDSYHEGICLDTFDRLIDTLANMKPFSLKGEWYENASALRVDPTCIIRPDNIQETLTQLSNLNKDPKYMVERKLTGLTIRGRATSNKYRLIFYDKHKELQMARNREFIKATPFGYVDKFYGSLRAETNLRKLSDIRATIKPKLRKDDTRAYLVPILESKENALVGALDKLTEKQMDLFAHDLYSREYSFKEKIERYGIIHIAELHDNDLNLIRSFIKYELAGTKTNPYKYLRKFKEVMASRSVEKKPTIVYEIENIRKLLEVAA